MALRVSILPQQRACVPGTIVEARIEIANHSDTQAGSPFGISIADLSVDFQGTERIDRTWVGLAYGADVPPLEKDNRRETREIVDFERLQLAQHFRLNPGEQRAWTLRLPLPEWAPPSFKGVAVRCGYVMTASVRFSASRPAMRLLSQQLSIETARRSGSVRGLILTPAIVQQISQKRRAGPLPPRVGEPPLEQTAAARVPLLVLPRQRLRNDVLVERRGAGGGGVVLMGEDAELQAVPYGHTTPHELEMDAQEFVAAREARNAAHHSLPRGISLSRSDLKSLPGNGDGSMAVPLRPVDAWPQFSSSTSGVDGLSRARDGAQAERQSPMPPATPMTGPEAAAATKTFNLRLGDRMLVRLAISPPAEGTLCLGTTLSGTLNFKGSQDAAARDPACPKCVQVAILLETEEAIHDRWTAGLPSQVVPSGIRKVQDEHQELTPDTVLTHFMLSIPYEAPASFSTGLLALRWVLRFEFTTTAQSAGGGWFGGGGKEVETLSWSLPILIQPGP